MEGSHLHKQFPIIARSRTKPKKSQLPSETTHHQNQSHLNLSLIFSSKKKKQNPNQQKEKNTLLSWRQRDVACGKLWGQQIGKMVMREREFLMAMMGWMLRWGLVLGYGGNGPTRRRRVYCCFALFRFVFASKYSKLCWSFCALSL